MRAPSHPQRTSRSNRLRAACLATGVFALLTTAACGASTAAGPNATEAPTTTEPPTTTTAPKPVSDQTPPKSTFGLAFDDRHLWVADFYGGQLLGIDPDTGVILKRHKPEDGIPEGVDDIAVGPDGSIFYTGFNDGSVGRMSPANVSVVIDGVGIGASSIAFSRDGRLFVGRSIIGDGLWEIDPGGIKPKKDAIVQSMKNVNAFAIGADGAVYGPRFGLGKEGALVRIDTTTGKETMIVDGFDAPIAVKLSRDAKTAYVLSLVPGGTPKVSTVDLGTKALKDLANLESSLADNLAVANDGRVFVSSFNEPMLTVINTDGTTKKLKIGEGTPAYQTPDQH